MKRVRNFCNQMKQHSNGKVSETTSGEEAIELWFARTPLYFYSGKNFFFKSTWFIISSHSHLYVCRPVLQHSESLTRTLSAIDQLRHEFPILRKWRQFLTNLIPRLTDFFGLVWKKSSLLVRFHLIGLITNT